MSRPPFVRRIEALEAQAPAACPCPPQYGVVPYWPEDAPPSDDCPQCGRRRRCIIRVAYADTGKEPV